MTSVEKELDIISIIRIVGEAERKKPISTLPSLMHTPKQNGMGVVSLYAEKERECIGSQASTPSNVQII